MQCLWFGCWGLSHRLYQSNPEGLRYGFWILTFCGLGKVGVGCRVCVLRLKVSGCLFMMQGLRCKVCGCGIGLSAFGLWSSSFRVNVYELGLKVRGLGCGVWNLMLRIKPSMCVFFKYDGLGLELSKVQLEQTMANVWPSGSRACTSDSKQQPSHIQSPVFVRISC